MPRKWTHNRAYKQAQYQQSRYRPTSFGYDSLGLSFDRVIRIRLVLVCMAVFCLALVARLYALQAYGSERWKLLALKQHQTTLEVMEPRASVADRNGQILAYSVPRVSLGIHPNLVQQPEKWSEALSLILDRPPSQIEAILKSQSRFAWLARSITKSQAEQVKQTKLPGLEFIQEYKREYPLGTLAGNLIGRVGADGQGLSGVELAFNHLLKADSYQLNLRRDARGQLVAPSRKQQTIFDATPAAASVDEVGNPRARIQQSEDLELTIDSSIQAIVEAEFAQGLSATKAKRIFGTILDADSGEILALAQTPSYDPNQPLQDLSELRNAVIEDSFEPGSTLKPLVAALALDHAVATPNETIDCEQGRFRIGRHLIEDVHPLGIASFGDILVRSSNVGITKIGQRLGKEQLYHGIKSLGFGSLSGVDLPGETRGIVRKYQAWAEVDVATHSFGQGLTVTALQLARAYAALMNGGMLVAPKLLVKKSTPALRVFSPEASDVVRDILYGVTESEHGTAPAARIQGVRVSGKTGTAQKAAEGRRGYDPEAVLASFVGFVDTREIGAKRRLVMVVVVDEPNVRPRWGGTLAGPIFKRSIERILSNLVTNEPNLRTHSPRKTI